MRGRNENESQDEDGRQNVIRMHRVIEVAVIPSGGERASVSLRALKREIAAAATA